MKIAFLFLSCLLSTDVICQNVLDSIVSEELGDSVYSRVKNMPELLVTEATCERFIDQNLIYPIASFQNGEEGTVLVGFIVNEDSTVTDFHILQGINPELNAEALRLAMMIRKIKPGSIDGKYVKVILALPIRFSIKDIEINYEDSAYANHPKVDSSHRAKVFQVVEQMPEFPGGNKAMNKFIRQNIRYPFFEKYNDIEGNVIVGFVVNEDGSISDIVIKQGVNRNLDIEAVRVVRLMPKFKPGRDRGKDMRVYFVVSIPFRLNNYQPSHIPEIQPPDPPIFKSGKK